MNTKSLFREYLKLICGICVLLPLAGLSFASEVNPETKVKATFELYRNSISADPESLSKYFSEETKEGWLGYLFTSEEPEEALMVFRALKSRASFGRRISKVYEFEVIASKSDKAMVRIVYKTPEGKGPFTYRINYIERDGAWKISQVASDTTQPGKGYKGKVLFEYE
jgi:hypothetical protein